MTVAATFAATLVDEWARAGLTHAVVCPGSRSTPLALALAADGRLQVHVRIDERSAGFLALGIGAATGRPAVVVVTSGTAAAELHPAVVEASYGRVPLVVCTADRPPELHGVGSAQTVDQVRLYGRAVRWAAEPGVPDADAAGSWRSLASRAVLESLGSPPGPVHLDLAFREPLVGSSDALPPGRAGDAPWHRAVVPDREVSSTEVARVADLLASPRGLVVAGAPGPDSPAVQRLAEATGWPVLADPRGEARVPHPSTVAAFDALVRQPVFADAHRPSVVVRFGQPPLSRALATWLAGSQARQVLIDPHGGWWDADRTASVVVAGPPSRWAHGLADALAGVAGGDGWATSWRRAQDRAEAALASVLDASPALTEPGIARRVVADLPDGATLVPSASMPGRHVEWYAAARGGIRVLANRGANGIDGVVSTAVGVASATGRPTTALVGDLAFLHDTNALLGLAASGVDLTVVVVDNAGGGIFSFLPQAREVEAEDFERLFATPQDVDIALLAAAHGLGTIGVHEADGLGPALEVARRTRGPHVVHVRTDRTETVEVHRDIDSAVAAALAAG